MSGVEVVARAKINLYLAVGQRRIGHEREACAGVLDHVGDLALGEAGVDRHKHRACTLRAQRRDQPCATVGRPDRPGEGVGLFNSSSVQKFNGSKTGLKI